MNNKGQIGDFIASVPVFLAVVVIMAVFVILSMGLLGVSAFKEKIDTGKMSTIDVSSLNLLFEGVDFKDVNAAESERMIFLEAHKRLVYRSSLDSNLLITLMNNLIQSATKDEGCYLLSWRINPNPSITAEYFVKTVGENQQITDLSFGRGSKFTEYLLDLTEYGKKSATAIVSFVSEDGTKKEITYKLYKGRCLE